MAGVSKLLKAMMRTKKEPLGIATDAHDYQSFTKEGDKVYDHVALGSHTARGRIAYTKNGLIEDRISQPEIDSIAQQLAKLDLQKQTEKNPSKLTRINEEIQNLSELFDESVAQSSMPRLLAQSEQTLDRPLYISRQEGAFTPSSGQPDSLLSAMMVEPKNLVDTPSPYGDTADIYRLEAGQKIYHPAGRADKNELVINRNELNKTPHKATEKEYVENLKKGEPLFGIAALPLVDGDATNIERNSFGGAIADFLKRERQKTNKLQIPYLGGVGDLMLGEFPELIEDMSWGMRPYKGRGQTIQLDNRIMDIL